MPGPLADTSDVEAVWRPLQDTEVGQVTALIARASAKLRHAVPFDIDARIALYATDPTQPTALDPMVVADVVATIVKRFMVNIEGVASSSEGVGPYSRSATFVNRYDKTGSDVRGAIQVIDSDIDQLRPAALLRPRPPSMVQLHPTRQMNPVSQWTWDRRRVNPATGLPDASWEPEWSDDPNSYDPTWDPDPTDDEIVTTTTTTTTP